MSGELLLNPDDIHQIYYSINNLLVYVGFGRGKKYLDFLLPCEGSCRCNWDQRLYKIMNEVIVKILKKKKNTVI